MAFYECGRCPFGGNCEHAHHFSELNEPTQMRLLNTVAAESLPSYFVELPATAGGLASSFAPSIKKSSSATAQNQARRSTSFGSGKTTGSSQRCRYTRKPTPADLPHNSGGRVVAVQPQMDASTSSHTSSSTGSPNFSHTKHLSPLPRGMDFSSFKIHLPARCRYPHRNIPGTYYDVLGLARDADHADVLQRYRSWQKEGFKRMRQVDPAGAEAVDCMIVEARNVLGVPALRAAYDQHLPREAAKAVPWTLSAHTFGVVATAGYGSTTTSPNTQYTQEQSSATSSSASSQRQRVDSPHAPAGMRSSTSSINFSDFITPSLSISGLQHQQSIW